MKPVAYSALLECFEKVKARLDARSAVQETAPKAITTRSCTMCSNT